ncbi:uncharacterized protein LOC117295338 [Asterias rubens]|uniref:uncharacterized protein LOC117295338 n=1 Tax=Asterias rubens TaxID=7604 RepID=UPI001455082D|nr:uncharacterized protein LOC117295338 [Asterias rubens]
MMAGVSGESNGVSHQRRIDKVQIVHAGEDVKVIQRLAFLLEEQLKLGEQVDYRRHFKQESLTKIANHIADVISNGSEDKGVVLVFSEKFNSVVSANPTARDKIKNILSRERHLLKIAMVSVGCSVEPFFKPCISLSSYIAKLEDGTVAEAIYKQWFGPKAQLTSQAEMSRNGLVNLDAAQDNYAPSKVKIIHAMTDPETKTHQRRLSDAIDAVVDPEQTTSSRIKFVSDQSIARTVLGDLECFQCCSGSMPKVHAVFVWCEVMLNALKQDTEAKQKVVDIVCRDTSQQKLYAHFLIGVTRQEISTFSRGLSQFLSRHGHIVVLETFSSHRPVNYEPFAQNFLSIWAGLQKVPKDPEESLDPTMNSLESLEFPLTIQSHPHQNKKGDRLVMNNSSISQSEAVRTQQMGKGFSDKNPSFDPQERMVTSNGSFDPRLGKVMKYPEEFQSDGRSNLHENSSRHHTLHGLSSADPSLANREAVPIRQPTSNVDGKNRMATGSIESVSMNCVTGPTMKNPPPSSEDRCAVSLPPSGGQQMGQQPSSRVPGQCYGKNKVAASGFLSFSVYGSSTRSDSSMSQGGVDQPSTLACSRDLGVSASDSPQQGHILSVGDNPIRIASSDYEGLSSEAAHELDDELRTVHTTSLGPDSSLRSDLQSLPNSDITGSASVVQSDRTGTGTMPSDVSSWTCGQSDGRQSVSYRQPENTDRVLSAPEGRNPLREGAACGSCGSVSLPFPGAATNAAQNSFPSVNSVQSQVDNGDLLGNIDQPAPEDTLLSDLHHALIRSLKIRLDPPKQTVADWQDVASYFGVGNVLITFWKGQKSDSSPTEQLLTWLKAEKQHLTVKDLKDALEKVKRRDVLRFLEKEGYGASV